MTLPIRRPFVAAMVALVWVGGSAGAQKIRTKAGWPDCPADSATPILAPVTPLPTEAASAGIYALSFFATVTPAADRRHANPAGP